MNRMGFTLIELVIVITILAVLAAVAIPSFQNLQKQAKDAATKGVLGAMREAIQHYRMNEIVSGRQPGAPGVFPQNGCPDCGVTGTEQFCAGPRVMANGVVPDNPWATGVKTAGRENWIAITETASKGTVDVSDAGWTYHKAICDIWANTAENEGPITENDF